MSKVLDYFESVSKWDQIFHDAAIRQGRINVEPVLGMPTKANARKWADKIHNDLSPENLHCDGEISRSVAAKKAKELNTALSYLEKLVGHKLPEVY